MVDDPSIGDAEDVEVDLDAEGDVDRTLETGVDPASTGIPSFRASTKPRRTSDVPPAPPTIPSDAPTIPGRGLLDDDGEPLPDALDDDVRSARRSAPPPVSKDASPRKSVPPPRSEAKSIPPRPNKKPAPLPMSRPPPGSRISRPPPAPASTPPTSADVSTSTRDAKRTSVLPSPASRPPDVVGEEGWAEPARPLKAPKMPSDLMGHDSERRGPPRAEALTALTLGEFDEQGFDGAKTQKIVRRTAHPDVAAANEVAVGTPKRRKGRRRLVQIPDDAVPTADAAGDAAADEPDGIDEDAPTQLRMAAAHADDQAEPVSQPLSREEAAALSAELDGSRLADEDTADEPIFGDAVEVEGDLLEADDEEDDEEADDEEADDEEADDEEADDEEADDEERGGGEELDAEELDAEELEAEELEEEAPVAPPPPAKSKPAAPSHPPSPSPAIIKDQTVVTDGSIGLVRPIQVMSDLPAVADTIVEDDDAVEVVPESVPVPPKPPPPAAPEAAESGPRRPPPPRRSEASELDLEERRPPAPQRADLTSSDELLAAEADLALAEARAREALAKAKEAEAKAREAAAKAARKKPWWAEMFEDDLLRTLDNPRKKDVAKEATFIEKNLRLEPGARVLDLACGAGVHAVELASRGYQVVGVDYSSSMLELAKQYNAQRGTAVSFIQGDMRKLNLESVFDGIYCWASSFGFFDDAANANVLERIARALRPGGTFTLDVVNRDFVTARAPSMAWFEKPGVVCMDDMRFDFFSSRMHTKRMVLFDNGKSREIEMIIRLYTLHELGRLLHKVGFKVLEVSGHRSTRGAYFGAESPQIIITGQRRTD